MPESKSLASAPNRQTRLPAARLAQLFFKLRHYPIAEFKAKLPGWWYSVCECQVSCDATCAPTKESPHASWATEDRRFDHGFDADLPQPSTLADALRDVMNQALDAIAERIEA